ncbi:MAG TPA: ABC transporter permease [Gemmatimonadales bacterium]|nr:ABC transporter permease [Gemmatimonadales bacterium]
MTVRDLRYAFRSLGRSPGFTAVAVLSLGLGLGLVTTMFAILDAVRHPAVPYRDADRLWSIGWVQGRKLALKPFVVLDAVRERTRTLDSVLPVAPYTFAWSEQGRDEGDLPGAEVPGRFFALLGVRPQLGRLLGDADAGRPVAVVSYELWRKQLGGRRSLAGATVVFARRVYSVVGVMPRGMDFPYGSVVWTAMTDEAERSGAGLGFVRGVARLRPGVTPAAVDSDLAGIARYLTARYGAGEAPFWLSAGSMRQDPMKLGDIHVAMLGASLAVLLIACANLANLMLARGLAKRREVALRLAIGASRAAVVRQLFVECAVLTVGGALAGIVLSFWGASLVTHRLPQDVWFLGIVEPQLSWRVFAFAALAAAASAVLFGLVPAIRVANAVSLDEPLKDGAGTTGRTRQRYSALVVSEVALALALLMGAGLLLKVVHRLATIEYNFPARQLLSGYVIGGLADSAPPAERLRLQLAVVDALRRAPGVIDAAAESSPVLPGRVVTAELSDSTRLLPSAEVVTPAHLRTMGLPVLQGRDFSPGDLVGNGAVILNTVAAARLYPRGNAVGRMLKLGAPASDAPWVPIVGVCRTALTPGFELTDLRAEPEVYVVRAGSVGTGVRLTVRVSGDPGQLVVPLRRAARAAVPSGDAELFPYLQGRQSAVEARAFLAQIFVAMGSFALVLAAIGIYGVMAYTVTRRLREFAVRVALGAERRDLVRTVLHDGVVMTLAGTGLGAFVALWTSFFLQNVLENVYPTDAPTLVAAEAVLLLVTVAACLAPAYRAARADPVEILRAT